MKPGAVQHQSTWHNVPGDMHMDYWKTLEKYGKYEQHTLLPDRAFPLVVTPPAGRALGC